MFWKKGVSKIELIKGSKISKVNQIQHDEYDVHFVFSQIWTNNKTLKLH